eukprot:COSAG01_NODE_3185_length_6428_cov_3.036722_2_plen_50_part_00
MGRHCELRRSAQFRRQLPYVPGGNVAVTVIVSVGENSSAVQHGPDTLPW